MSISACQPSESALINNQINNSLYSLDIQIPFQLQRNDIRFVLVQPNTKIPISTGWNLVSNGLIWNDIRLLNHLKIHGNYGYYPAPGSNLLSLDIDDTYAFHKAGGDAITEKTFKYSAWADWSKYRAIISCPDIPNSFIGTKISIRLEGIHPIVEIFFPANPLKTAGQCVGPGSQHPNGSKYSISDSNAPIINVYWREIEAVIQTLQPKIIEEKIPEYSSIQIQNPKGKTIAERYDLSIQEHLPINPYFSGQEIRGIHPIHGSSSKGGNIAMNPHKGLVYCFRCSKGYDIAGWDAVCKGIIQCGDPYDYSAIKRHLKALDLEKPEVRYREKIAWKNSILRGRNHE